MTYYLFYSPDVQCFRCETEHELAEELDQHICAKIDTHAVKVKEERPSGEPKRWIDEAKKVVDHRRDNYGSPLLNFLRIAERWTSWDEHRARHYTPIDVAWMMCDIKSARELNAHTPDNGLDTIGYIDCYNAMDEHMHQLGYAEGVTTFRTMTLADQRQLRLDLSAGNLKTRQEIERLEMQPDAKDKTDTIPEILVTSSAKTCFTPYAWSNIGWMNTPPPANSPLTEPPYYSGDISAMEKLMNAPAPPSTLRF